MAQIMPPKYNLGDQIGQSLSQSFQRSFEPAIQQQYQKGQLQNALQGLNDIPQNASPAEIGKYLLSATAGLPDQGRILQALYGPMVAQANARRSPGISEIKAGDPFSQPQPFQGGQAAQTMNGLPIQPQQINQGNGHANANISPQNIPQTSKAGGVGISLGTYIPTNTGTLITPEKQAEILKNIQLQGGDVDFTRNLIKDYNEGKLNFQDLINSNVDKQSVQITKQLQLEKQVKQFIDNQVPKDIPETEKNIYYNLMKKELPKHNDLTSAYQAVSKDISDFNINKDKYIKNIPQADMFGIASPKENILRSSAQNLLKIDPLAYNILEEAYVQKGHSIVTPAKVLRPLPEPIKQVTKSANDYRDILYPKTTREISDREMLSNITKAQDSQSKEVPKLSKQLEKKWNNDISLINIYSDLKTKGWFPEQIFELFDQISQTNGLSQQQEKEKAQLINPPRIPLRYLNG